MHQITCSKLSPQSLLPNIASEDCLGWAIARGRKPWHKEGLGALGLRDMHSGGGGGASIAAQCAGIRNSLSASQQLLSGPVAMGGNRDMATSQGSCPLLIRQGHPGPDYHHLW